MKKNIYLVCLSLLTLTFMACPYKSKTPLSTKPGEKIDMEILGEYEKKGSSSYTYKVEKESDVEYKFIRTSTSESSKSKPSEYYGYTTTINGKKFLQMYKKSKYSSSIYYYMYRMSSNASKSIMTLEPVTEHIKEKFDNSKDLIDFITKHQDLSFFFGKTEKYYKSE